MFALANRIASLEIPQHVVVGIALEAKAWLQSSGPLKIYNLCNDKEPGSQNSATYHRLRFLSESCEPGRWWSSVLSGACFLAVYETPKLTRRQDIRASVDPYHPRIRTARGYELRIRCMHASNAWSSYAAARFLTCANVHAPNSRFRAVLLSVCCAALKRLHRSNILLAALTCKFPSAL
jgi:hypothetical protein